MRRAVVLQLPEVAAPASCVRAIATDGEEAVEGPQTQPS